ncbi:MAG: hypothetical protein LBC68_13925, partial [Prevotellaceae bacterium]|nr:hypothetical protein [Prevotellaceae bacterium]
QVQSAVSEWVKRYKKESDVNDNHFLEVAINAYLLKDFELTVNASLKFLQATQTNDINHQKSVDKRILAVRNNLALALMHQNKDLCAQVELEIIYLENKTSYQSKGQPINLVARFTDIFIPGAINLTVVYERLGMTDKAKMLAHKLKEYAQYNYFPISLVEYNAAWFLDEKELRHNDVSSAIYSLKESKQEKHRQMVYRLSRSQTWIQAGVVRFFDLSDSNGMIIITVFSILIWYLYYRLLKKCKPPVISSEALKVVIIIAVILSFIGLLVYENLLGYLLVLFTGLICLIAFYYIIIMLALSFLLFLLVWGYYDVGDVRFYLYMLLSLIMIIIAAVAAKKRQCVRC